MAAQTTTELSLSWNNRKNYFRYFVFVNLQNSRNMCRQATPILLFFDWFTFFDESIHILLKLQARGPRRII
jgi:hypothetical protein